MYTISDIITDIDRGCMANNLVEDRFSYRIVFFVNDGNRGTKYYINTTYKALRKSLEGIIKKYLTLENNIVIAETTIRKDGKSICLQSRTYSFGLEEYFRQINGECNNNSKGGSISYSRYAIG